MGEILRKFSSTILKIYDWKNRPSFISIKQLHYKQRNNHFDPNFEESVYGPHPRTHNGGITLITLAPGFGSDVQWNAVQEILKCAGAPVEFEYITGAETSDEELDNLLLSIRRNGIAIKGNIETRRTEESSGIEISRNMVIRKSLDLFVRVNWLKSLKPLKHLMKVHEDLDIVLIRQNTEGEFSLIEYKPLPHMVEHLAIVTRYNCKRIAEYAFKYSKKNGRKKITLILNKSVIPESEELFNESFLGVAMNYPEINYEVLDIARFVTIIQHGSNTLDVILASSLIGSILVSILQGYLGSSLITPSLNVGDKFQVWEASYMSTIQKQKEVISASNPLSHIFVVVSILRNLGAHQSAEAISKSLDETLREGVLTKDLGGSASLEEFTRFLISCLKPKVSGVQCSFDDPPKLPPLPPPTEPFRSEFMPGMVPPNPNYKEFPPPMPGGKR